MTDKSSSAITSGTPSGESSRSCPSINPFSQSSTTGVSFLRNVLPSGINPTGRLQSIRPPRDLTLGMATAGKSTPRRSFTPTIPQRTRKVDDKATPMEKDQILPGETRKRGRGRGRGRPDERRRSGSGRSEREVKQSASVFSAGPAEKTIRRQPVGFSGSGSGRKTDGKDSQWPSQKTVKVENCEQERTDVGGIVDMMDTCENVFSGPVEMAPVCLPLTNSSSSAVRHGRSLDRLAACAFQSKAVHPTCNGIIKHEKMEIDEEADAPVPHFPKQKSACATAAAGVFSEIPCDQLVFMQFPDCICTAVESKDDGPKERDSQPRTSLAAAPSGYAGRDML